MNTTNQIVKLNTQKMNLGTCKRCGGDFWETSPGARGEDLCDSCDNSGLTEPQSEATNQVLGSKEAVREANVLRTEATQETFWTDISSRKAWKLANENGKLPPYAGYLIEMPQGKLRCVRDDLGTRFQFKPVA